MIDDGIVKIDDPVQRLLPSDVTVPARNGRPITLGNLVGHRAGLPRFPSNFGLDRQTDPAKDYTPELLYEFLANHKLARTPDDIAVYSNTGFGLLGQALALRAGQPYEDLVRSRVLQPLGIDRTVIAVPAHLQEAVATGHDDALDPVPAWQFGAMAGAGAFLSSAADMLLFLDALRASDRSPVGEAIATLRRPQDEGGLGFGTPHPDGGTLLAHTGGTGGFRSYLGCLPAWDRGVVVLSNASIEGTFDLGRHLLDARYGLAMFRTEAQIDARQFENLVGRYRLAPDQIFDVTISSDRLLAQLTGQPAYRVFPSSAWTVSYRCVGAQLTFKPGVDGRAARLILHQNGHDQHAERIASRPTSRAAGQTG